MNVVRRALIRSAGIRTLVRFPVLRNPPLRFSSTTPNDALVDQLSLNPYNVEPQSLTTPVEEDNVADDSNPAESNSLSSALRRAVSFAEIQSISKNLGVEPTIKHYSVVINSCLRSGRKDEAFDIYEKMKEVGISPDSRLTSPLLRSLDTDATAGSVDRALEIYRDLVEAHPSTSLQNVIDGSAGPNTYIYSRLFRILLSSSDQEKYIPTITSLITDMEARLPAGSSFLSTTRIILEMRQRRLFTEALDVYRKHRPNLDEYGFFEILKEYCRLSFVGALDVPLITQYFSIVNDMRVRRIPISPNVYGLIIKHIILMVEKIKKGQANDQAAEALPRLVSTIRRVHDFLTLDASLSPTPQLWNQLIDAYQRLGCFADAYRLWDMMYLTGRYTQVTVTIMLDACGYAGQYEKARSILKKLERAGFKLDVRNWNTWVECLCRLHRFDEALDVVFVQMPRQGKEPNIDSINVLNKFAKKYDIPRDFMGLVEKEFPQLWNRLPNTIRKS